MPNKKWNPKMEMNSQMFRNAQPDTYQEFLPKRREMTDERMKEDDIGICLGMYQMCPVLACLFEKGKVMGEELGQTGGLYIAKALTYMKENKLEPLFFIGEGWVEMRRWDKRLLEALKILDEKDKKLVTDAGQVSTD